MKNCLISLSKVLIVQVTDSILMQENAILCIRKHYFLHRDVFLAKCIYLYLLLFLLWHWSDTNMQECSRYRVISITNPIISATLAGINENSLMTFPCIPSGFHKIIRHAGSHSVNSQNIKRVTQILGSKLAATSWIDIYLSRHKDQPQFLSVNNEITRTFYNPYLEHHYMYMSW